MYLDNCPVHLFVLFLQLPQEPDPWADVYQAFDLGLPCPQSLGMIAFTHPQWNNGYDEDCIHFNLVTPVSNLFFMNAYSPIVFTIYLLAVNAVQCFVLFNTTRPISFVAVAIRCCHLVVTILFDAAVLAMIVVAAKF